MRQSAGCPRASAVAGPAGRRWPQVLAGIVALVALAAGVRTGPAPAATAQSAPPTLAGTWQTFANGNNVLALAWDDGVLWAGTHAGGLVRWDTATGDQRQFLAPQVPIGANTVFDVAIDAAGRLWLATPGGLTIFDDRGDADPGNDFWFTYTTETGLGMPSQEVRAVAVDGRYVWIGGVQSQDVATGAWSGGGLGRVDTAGTEAPEDDVWAPVSTFASTYREETDGTSEPGLVSDTIHDIAVTPQGNLWIAAGVHYRMDQGADPSAPPTWQRGHGGLTFLDTRGTPATTDDQFTGLSCELLELVVTCNVRKLGIDPRGRAWAADWGRGLMQFDATRPQLVSSPELHLVPPSGEGDPFVSDFAFGPADDPALRNTVWMATRGGGLSVVDHKGTLATTADDTWNFDRGGPFTTADDLSMDRLQAIAAAPGRMWLGYGVVHGEGGGIQSFDLDGRSVGDVRLTSGGPSSNFVTDLAFGAAGSLWEDHVWIGTGSKSTAAGARMFGSGVVDLDTAGTGAVSDDTWTSYTKVNTDPDGVAHWSGLAGDNVHAVLVRGDQVWVGSAETAWSATDQHYTDGGVSVFDGTRWTARRTDNTGGAATGLGGGGVSSLAGGCAGEVWVGTGNVWDRVGSGVFVLTPGADVHSLSGDSWVRHRYPQLASANTTAIDADCAGRRVWVAATHHVNTTDTGGSLGVWSGGGLAGFNLDASTWTRHGSREGLETYAQGAITGEAVSVRARAGGGALVGTYGTRTLNAGGLVATKPFWSAVVNEYDGSAWTNRVFEHAGAVSSLAYDADGRLWAATTRGGAARVDTENTDRWPWDRSVGGVFVREAGTWYRLDADRDGVPSNDVAVVRVAPDDTVWLGSEGWGLARFDSRADVPTRTPTLNLPTRTPTPTLDPNAPTATPRSTVAVPTIPPPRPSPTGVATATATRDPHPKIFLTWVTRRR